MGHTIEKSHLVLLPLKGPETPRGILAGSVPITWPRCGLQAEAGESENSRGTGRAEEFQFPKDSKVDLVPFESLLKVVPD